MTSLIHSDISEKVNHGERVELISKMSPWQRMGQVLNFGDPFTCGLTFLQEHIRRSSDTGGVIAINDALKSILFNLHELQVSMDQGIKQLDQAVELFPKFEENLLAAQAIYLAALGRARAEHRKDRIREFSNSVKERTEELQLMYSQLAPAHLLLQQHFWQQVLKTPRASSADSVATAAFYEPLYTLRDQYFRTPTKAVLVEYLRIFEELTTDAYYLEHVIPGVDPQELSSASALVDELTTELEVCSFFK